MITIYQIPLTNDQINRANALGFDAVPEVLAKTRMQLGFGKFKEEYLSFFRPIYEVDTDDLDEAFDATNIWEGFPIKRLAIGSSTSVGDIAVLNGNCYFCDTFGWVNMGKYEGMI
jgi:hypothetical protein